MSVIPVVSYLPTELVGYSMDPEINHGTRRLTRIPRVINKKKKKEETMGALNLGAVRVDPFGDFTLHNTRFDSER